FSLPICMRVNIAISPASTETLPSSNWACSFSILKALGPVLLRQGNPGPLQRLASAVTRPCPRQLLAPAAQGRSVYNWRCFLQTVGFRNIDDIGVTIPNQLYGRKRVIPAEIHSADLWPMGWKLLMLDCQRMFGNRKYPPRSQGWNSLCACFQLMRRITCNDGVLLFFGIVPHIVDGH